MNTTNLSILYGGGNDTITSFFSSGSGAFTVAGGTLSSTVPGTGTFQVNGAFAITGGTLSGFVINGGSPLVATNNSANGLNNITSNVGLDLTNSGRLNITGGLTLNATARVAGGGILSFSGTQNLSGAGSINFTDTNTGNRLTVEGNSTLTIGNGFTIQGYSGQIGAAAYNGGTGNLINYGSITSNGGGTITLNQSGTFTNAGKVDAITGSVLAATSYLQTAGETQANGMVSVNGGGGTLTMNGGKLDGSGSLVGSVINNGGFIMGASTPSGLTVTGNLDETSGGTTVLNISSLNTFSLINVGGTASLSGTLDVTLTNFVPVVGDTFQFINYSALNGPGNYAISALGGYKYVVDYFSGDAVLTIEGSGATAAPEPGSLVLLVLPILGTGAAQLTPRRGRGC